MSLGQFDATPTFSTSAARAASDSLTDDLVGYLKRSFREFIRNFRLSSLDYVYRDRLTNNLNMKNYSLEVDIDHINHFDNKMFLMLSENPSKVLNIFEKSALEYVQEISMIGDENSKYHIKTFQILLLTNSNSLSIRELNSKMLDKFIKIEGIVVSLSSLRSKAVSMTIQCKGCKNKISNIIIPNAIENYPLPKKCPTEQIGKDACPYDPFIIIPDQSTCIDSQICIIQESPQTVPQGEMPRHMQIYLDRSLCDKVVPGNYILVSGIFSIKNTASKDKSGGGSVGIRSPYVKATGLEMLRDGISQSVVSSLKPHEEILFKQLSKRSDIYEVLCKSIAPSIYGNEDIKKSLLCLLFGGSRKQMPDSLLRRGDINILLLGDPGTAKSQLLKFVEKCSPIAVYTSGKGSSAAGLTASVLKDGNSKGFMIEGGAMVLADGGVVCIDEFDKMREEDRVTIHEAMEQQTISIAKAGITSTLNTRCSVLAAANSVYGRWDDTKGDKNIDLMPTILSRFDMIYIIKDAFNEKKDSVLAKHVVDIHSNDQIMKSSSDTSEKVEKLTTENVSTIRELDVGTLRRYISYCRMNCGPRLSDQAANKLKLKYVSMRNGPVKENEQKKSNIGKGSHHHQPAKSTIPITVRQLEALIRIAESLAKMRLSSFTSSDDVDEAIRLFQVSTLSAAKSGKLVGVEGVTTYSDQTMLLDIEKQLRKRFIPGSQVAVKSILSDFTNQNYPEVLVQRVIDLMVYRGNAQFNKSKSLIIRVK